SVLFDVNPPLTGHIVLDGEQLEAYPEIRNLPADFVYNLAAGADLPFWEFNRWEVLHSSPEPDSSQVEVGVEFTQSDMVTAHFREIPNYLLTFITEPKNVGKIRFGDLVIDEFPYTQRYEGQIPYGLEAILPNNYEFDVWEFVMQPNLSSRIYPSIQYTPIRNDTIILRMNERFSDVFIPSAFSPNGDGVNELIKVHGLEIAPDGFEWVIFSRFGDIVFETNDTNGAWNGGVMNSDYYCPVGIYSYHLKYKNAINNQEDATSGSIMLIR
ncbi:MAG: gliding motility-associated C-terminal domain-containing protein, partial [Cryomorphaceae bacterium]